MNMKKSLVAIVSAAILLLAGSFIYIAFNTNNDGSKEKESVEKTEMPVNISVFLDLSDRLDSTRNGGFPVSQMARDAAIVGKLVDYFVETCVKHKISENKNHFQILFHPTPNTTDIASIAANLNVDMAKISNPGEKKRKLIAMKEDFSKGLSVIYGQTLRAKTWLGSDIWGFFCNKNAKVDELCVRKGYRNIMVILTDGYIYYKDNRQSSGNSAYSYILPKLVDNVPDLSLLAPRKGLGNLDVMMLEINPGKPTRQAKLISILEKWLDDMGIKHYVVTETGMPSDTQTIIDNFLKGN